MTPAADRTREGLAVAAAALAFGVAADVLGRTLPDRLHVAVGVGAFVLCGGLIVYRGLVPVPRRLAPLAGPAALLTVALIWRDSEKLYVLNLLGLMLLLALAAPRVLAVGRRRAGLGDIVTGAVQIGAGTAAGAAPLLLTDIDWRTMPEQGSIRGIRGALLGIVVAVPVALVFGNLLMNADPVFERVMTAALVPGLDRMLEHALVVLLWAWLAAGLLHVLLLRTPGGPRPPSISIGPFGIAEVGTVLLVVDLLFAAFVAVQVRYLFGGGELVRAVTGLSYAEYARQGFFQLVAVAALSLPLLLVADWALGRRDATSVRRFRVLALLMVLLLNVMLASALWRMRLYTAEYGLTELRLYTTGFMGWLVLVFGWLVATILRGRRDRFGFGAIVAGYFVLTALNLVNPDRLIAGTNLERVSRGRPVDVAYLKLLSADAVPIIRRALPTLPLADRCAAAALLRERWVPELERRERWNIGRVRAVEALAGGGLDCPPGHGG